jgi:uracil-DNA glycosylase
VTFLIVPQRRNQKILSEGGEAGARARKKLSGEASLEWTIEPFYRDGSAIESCRAYFPACNMLQRLQMTGARGSGPTSLSAVTDDIISCNRCRRLRAYCQEVGRIKKAAFRNELYWARPVPGFGDPDARLLILGLAPAAHGANRTGRVFTGDGAGASGDFLMSALKRAGFANISTSQRTDDGLTLTGAYIAAAVRCAPPDNKPLPEEVDRCLVHLQHELAHLPHVRVVVTLGKIAWDAWLKLLALNGDTIPRPRPAFGHGASWSHNGKTLIGAYHPSRQNTNTGVLTARMYDDIFRRVKSSLA